MLHCKLVSSSTATSSSALYVSSFWCDDGQTNRHKRGHKESGGAFFLCKNGLRCYRRQTFCFYNFILAPHTGLRCYWRKTFCLCNFVLAPHTETGRQTDRPTEDRKSLGEHISYGKMVSGDTGDKLFVFANLF